MVHLEMTLKPVPRSLVQTLGHLLTDSSNRMGAMNNNRVYPLALLEFESDGTTLTLEDTETSVRHGSEEVLPGKAAGRIFSILGEHGSEDSYVVTFDDDLDWLRLWCSDWWSLDGSLGVLNLGRWRPCSSLSGDGRDERDGRWTAGLLTPNSLRQGIDIDSLRFGTCKQTTNMVPLGC
jgi:hypothetical protein